MDGSISAAVTLPSRCMRGEPLSHLTRRGSSAIFAVHDQDGHGFCPFRGEAAFSSLTSLPHRCLSFANSNSNPTLPADPDTSRTEGLSTILASMCCDGQRVAVFCTLFQVTQHPAKCQDFVESRWRLQLRCLLGSGQHRREVIGRIQR